MKDFLTSSRGRWLLGIVAVAVGSAITAKNVISYPEECKTDITATSLMKSFNGIS